MKFEGPPLVPLFWFCAKGTVLDLVSTLNHAGMSVENYYYQSTAQKYQPTSMEVCTWQEMF